MTINDVTPYSPYSYHFYAIFTSREYVLVRAEVFERLKNLLDGDSELAITDTYPLIDAVMAREGWDDPAMDIYNDLAPKDTP